MYIQALTFNAFSENTYLVWDDTREAVIIDPGCSNYEERQVLQQFVEEKQLNIKYLLNTHAHIDHILGNDFVKKTYGVELYLHPNDRPIYEAAQSRSVFWGFGGYVHTEVDQWLAEGDVIRFGQSELHVILVPGHAPGHVAFVNEEERICLSGDVLFKMSVGRTDFELCNHDHLMDSIRHRLFALPDDTVVFPGHGPTTTIGFEKAHNPYVNS
jgi:hydroxyacylglutathione hydrolase